MIQQTKTCVRQGPAVQESANSEVTRFDAYEVHGVKRFLDGTNSWCEQVSDDEADFWSLYGHIPAAGLECIGDFATRDFAEQMYTRITGELYRPGRRV